MLHVTPRSPALPLSGLTISPQKVSKGMKGGDGKWGMDQGQGKGEDREEGNSCFTEKFTTESSSFFSFWQKHCPLTSSSERTTQASGGIRTPKGCRCKGL